MIGFIFPGQGSQTVGMLSSLAEVYPLVKQTFIQSSEILDYNLWKLVQYGPVSLLDQTEHAQPALLTASVALWRIWQQSGGPMPSVMVGHSLGEYSALVCADVIDFEQAVRLVRQRGLLMQQSLIEGRTGCMVAILGLSHQQVINACRQATIVAKEEVVEAVNFNTDNQVVIAGETVAVERAAQLCKIAGARRILPLKVSVPSHCRLMKPASQELALTLQEIPFSKPQCPVINNVNVTIETDPLAIKEALVKQLYSPVRWYETVLSIKCMGITHLFELGPGSVLTRLVKSITNQLSVAALHDPVVLNEKILTSRQIMEQI